MRICEHCGAQLHDGEPLCSACGNAATGLKNVKTGRPDAFDALSLLFFGVAILLIILGLVRATDVAPTADAAESIASEDPSAVTPRPYGTPEEVAESYFVSFYTETARQTRTS